MATFSTPLNIVADRTVKKLTDVVQIALTELFTEINRRTPVDTRRLKMSWHLAVGTPDESQGIDEFAHLKARNAPVGGVLYYTNSLDYAYRIEYQGWSHTKAPQGMVRISIADFATNVSSAIQKAGSL